MNRALPHQSPSPLHDIVLVLRDVLVYFHFCVDNPHYAPDIPGTGANAGTMYYDCSHLRHVCVGVFQLWGIRSLEELMCLSHAQVKKMFRFRANSHVKRLHDAVRLLLMRRNIRWVLEAKKNREQKMAKTKAATGYTGVYQEGTVFVTGAYVKKKWVPLGTYPTVEMAAFAREFYVHHRDLRGTVLNWSQKKWEKCFMVKPKRKRKCQIK